MKKNNSWSKSRKLAVGIAAFLSCCGMASISYADEAITVTEGAVTKDYDSNATFNEQATIAGGPWVNQIGAAISAGGSDSVLDMNMNGNTLDVDVTNDSHSTGIAAINSGIVNINAPGDMSVTAKSNSTTGQTAALFVNGGGKIYVHNTGDNTLSLTGSTASSTHGAVVKAMNGSSGTRSYIKIDGLVDIKADTTNGVGMSEAVSAVASTIDIGGGKIIATKNGVNPGLNYGFADNCAIRAYGEFVSNNYGIVNVNVTKESDALDAKATCAGTKTTVIEGDLNTVGGMGTKGIINIGLNDENSHWTGDYVTGAGWGETPGDYGSVNLFMGNGAQWLGNASYATHVQMSGAGTTWKGYSLNDAVSATITDGAAWYNFNEGSTTALLQLNGGSSLEKAGLVFMTPFTKKVDGKDKSYDPGNVTIANYSGNMKVFYNHDSSDVTDILGGTFTISNAEAGSAIRLITDNEGIDVTCTETVSKVLNKLANKLYYTAYASGENNLNGTVVIAEGLTASSAEIELGSISYSREDGQGSYTGSNGKAVATANSIVSESPRRLMRANLMQVNSLNTANVLTTDKEAAYTEAIEGKKTDRNSGAITYDTSYVNNGVFDSTTDTYNFTVSKTQIAVDDHVINASPTANTKMFAAISAQRDNVTTLDLHGNDLEVISKRTSDNKVTAVPSALLAVGYPGDSTKGILEIKNAGAISLSTVNEVNFAAGYALYSSGKIYIHNGGENVKDKVLTVRTEGKDDPTGGTGVYLDGANLSNSPEVIIDGLVDIQKVATGIYSTGGKVEMAGGIIQAANNLMNIGNKQKTIVNINVAKDDDGNVIGAGSNTTQLKGNIATNSSGSYATISLGLSDEESYLTGNITGNCHPEAVIPTASGTMAYGVNLYMDNGAQWTGSIAGNVPLALRMHNGSVWTGGNTDNYANSKKAMSVTLDTGSIWKNNGNAIAMSYFTGGDSEANRGIIDMTESTKTGDVSISNYAGNTLVIYGRNDEEVPSRVYGGGIVIDSAAEGSVITVSTDNTGIDTSDSTSVTKTLNNLAKKLTYNGAIEGKENNLTAYTQIAEGLTASSAALKIGDVEFSEEDGKGSLVDGSVVTPDNQKNPDIIYGSSETAMMKGAKTAMASSALMWRAETNDIMKRMGDLRMSDGESGVWAKYYGGKYQMDGQNTNLSLKYNAYQVGYDREVGSRWKVGVALSHSDGKSNYGTGHADLDATSLGVYGTWSGKSGQYFDVIAKYTWMDDDFNVTNTCGHKLNGDYKTWGASLSTEYGKRFDLKDGMYVDPSVELTIGRLAGKDYTAESDYLGSWGKNKGLSVEQDAFTSCIGRIGVKFGQKTERASYYLKLAAAHEFSGDFDTKYHAEGEQDGKTSLDFGGTWCEVQLGLTAKLSNKSMMYASIERSFGGDVKEKCRVDAGLRFSF